MNYQVAFSLSEVPQELSDARVGDSFLFFDNLEGDSKFEKPKHPHFPVKNENMIVFSVVKGSLHLRINLQEVVLHNGQVVTIMPGCIFQVEERSDDLRFFCMMIGQEVVDSIHKNFDVHVGLAHKYYNFNAHTVPPEAMEYGLTMYQLIKKELKQPDYEYKVEVIQRYCEIWILKSLSKSTEKSLPELNKAINRKEQIFRDFLTLLEKNYRQERSIAFYADRLCLTPKYLSTIIKEVSGKHGLQWIDEYVALEAKALLREGNLSVKQVSDSLNFPSQSMFGRFFKKMTGYTPKKYMLL